jgi:hypothetical protein
MKTVALICLLALVSMPIEAADVGIESVDYAKIKDLLPPGWIIKSVTVAEAPTGWRQTRGSRGMTVSFENPTVTIHDRMVGDYHPMYSFTLVPLDWEGKSMLGAVFADGRIQQEERDTPEQVYPDHFQKSYRKFRYFDSYLGRGDWKKPFEDLSKYFDTMEKSSNKRIDTSRSNRTRFRLMEPALSRAAHRRNRAAHRDTACARLSQWIKDLPHGFEYAAPLS